MVLPSRLHKKCHHIEQFSFTPRKLKPTTSLSIDYSALSMQEPINIDDQLSGSKSSESGEMDEPIRNEVAGPVSWLIPAPPKRVRSQLPQPPELRGSSSPKNRNNRSVNHPPHSTYNDVPQSGGGTPSHLSPNRTRNSNFSPPGSPNSAKTSSVLRAWTKIFEVNA
jgi:hypothetical protein